MVNAFLTLMEKGGVLHIVHVLTRLLRGGSEENTVETCRWQVAHGHRVTLVHGADVDPHWRDHLPKGIERVCVQDLRHPLHPIADLRALRRLRAIYRDLQPDVIHTHQSKAGILGRLAADAVPTAVVVHGIHIVPFQNVRPSRRTIYLAAEGRAAQHTDLYLSVTDAAGEAFVDAGIASPEQVQTVRSGMNLERFRRARRSDDWQAMLGLADGDRRPPVAVMLAALEPRKGHVPFLEALARVSAPPFKLLIAGAGPEERQLRAAVARLGLSDRVSLLGHREDPEALLALADVSVLTSVREGLPRVAVQSMAAGCPMVVQDLPGIRELITDGVNGLILPTADMDATAHALSGLLSDPFRLEALAQGARGTDVTDWSWATLGSRTTALYPVHRDVRAVA